MSTPVQPIFAPGDLDALATQPGRIAVLAEGGSPKSPATKRLDKLTRGAVSRLMASEAWTKCKPGEAMDLAYPAGLAAESLQLISLPRRATQAEAQKAGGTIGRALAKAGTLVVTETHARTADVAYGLALRAYDFAAHKTAEPKEIGPVTFHVANPDAITAAWTDLAAVVEGVHFTRDLVNEPSNVLTTFEFAQRLEALRDLGLDVEVFEEEQLTHLGMNLLLGVGQGSESPTKMVVIQWNGGEKNAAPLAIVGKGVVFDTGGISNKGASGMEGMAVGMGGAGVVAGLMRALA
ncbi:MAG: leucyl aminopeptidase, partial [Candidatus Saccharibacteria bacterium]|nr:leucyl aminopeptidase [Pseudorhodobacter sp.]